MTGCRTETLRLTVIYNMKLPSAVTLGGAYDQLGAFLVGQQGYVLQWAVGLHQRQLGCLCGRKRSHHSVPS